MPEVSGALMNTKIDHVEDTGAETLVGYDMSCLMHLAGGMRRRGLQVEVRHIAEILADGDIT
jgi:L-lactate dehydrogenase complex protein LldE